MDSQEMPLARGGRFGPSLHNSRGDEPHRHKLETLAPMTRRAHQGAASHPTAHPSCCDCWTRLYYAGMESSVGQKEMQVEIPGLRLGTCICTATRLAQARTTDSWDF